MIEFRVLLSRSHFDRLAVAAADLGDGEDSPPGLSETGWYTRFDGGGNTTIPSDFVVLFGEGRIVAPEAGQAQGDLFALVLCQGWAQDPWRERRVFLRHRRFTAPDVAPECDGLNWVEEAYEASFAPQSEESDWEIVEEAGVPEHARKTMEKSIAIVSALFGQGGDFFEV